MSKNKKIKFIKVEADGPLLTFHSPRYEPEARLYLEYLENKAKVKPQLRNTEWISKNVKGYIPSIQDDNVKDIFKSDKVEKSPQRSPVKPKIIDITNATDNDIREFEEKAIKNKDDLDNLSGSIKFGFKQKLRQQREERERRDSDTERRSERDDRRDDRSERDDRRDDRSERDEKRSEKKEESLLSKMLKGEDTAPPSNQTPSQETQIQPQQVSQVQQTIQIPPSISEITSGKVQVDSNGIRNLDFITKDEQNEQELKKDLLRKFSGLKRKWPVAHIPNHTEHTDLQTLQKDYKYIVKQLEIEEKAQRYKQWLIWGFLGLEFILLNFGSFEDIRGFYDQQKNSMNQYEELLYELGEKNYIADEKKWPVEIRLLLLMGSNVIFFVIGRMAERKYGINPMTMFSNINKPQETFNSYSSQQQPNQQTQQQSSQFPQKKSGIKPPEFDFEDIAQKKTN